MIQKEVSELRRHLQPDKNAISRIYGCYVNSSKEVVAYLDESIGMMPQEEAEMYFGFLKKTLSGTLGRNLIDIVFSTQQVVDSDEHRLLSSLRNSGLKDTEARERFYQTVIQSLDMGDRNYLILMAHDTYDVPYRGKNDDIQTDAADEVFSYFLCCICPVKDGKLELGYFSGDNEFHTCAVNQIVSAPELGFLFPAFDDRAANIYNALFYSSKPDQLHQKFIDAVFHTDIPMSASEQKEAFQSALTEALDETCSMGVMQAVHEQLLDKIEQHKESKNPEPLTLSARDVGAILQDCGIAEERVTAFCEQCGEHFGGDIALNPENLINKKRFEIKTTDATVSVNPECSYLVETRIIDGRKYILIPADENVEVNGMPVKIITNTEN